jgi:hypothetical protein
VQKVRCAEVDMFDPKVWEAVQLTTRSKRTGEQRVIHGSIEAFSTLNGPDGVMQSLLTDAKRKIFTWCVWDVIERCDAPCEGCILFPDCQGKAHQSEGFIPVSDVRSMRKRVRDRTWQ